MATVSPPISQLLLTDTHIKSGTDNIRCKCFRVFSSQQPIQALYCVDCRRVTRNIKFPTSTNTSYTAIA